MSHTNTEHDTYRIGYIDEDIVEVKKFKRRCRDYGISLEGFHFDKNTELEELMLQVIDSRVELLFIDFKLDNMQFDGDDIEAAIEERYTNFPHIIFTNNADDAENHVDFDKVFSKDNLNRDDEERTEKFCENLKKKIDNSRSRIGKLKNKLDELLLKGNEKGLTPSELSDLKDIKHHLKDHRLSQKTIKNQNLLEDIDFEELSQVRRESENYIKLLIKKNNASS